MQLYSLSQIGFLLFMCFLGHDNIIAYQSCACHRTRRNGTANFDLRRNNYDSFAPLVQLTHLCIRSFKSTNTHKSEIYILSKSECQRKKCWKNRFIELAIWQVLSPRFCRLQVHSIVFIQINSFIETVCSQLDFWEHSLNLACKIVDFAKLFHQRNSYHSEVKIFFFSIQLSILLAP